MRTETLKELRRHFRAIEVALLREIEEREKDSFQPAQESGFSWTGSSIMRTILTSAPKSIMTNKVMKMHGKKNRVQNSIEPPRPSY